MSIEPKHASGGVQPSLDSPGVHRPPWSEQAGRIVSSAALITLVFTAWATHLNAVAEWNARELRVLPALSIFILCALVALFVQRGGLSKHVLLAGGLASSMLLLGIQHIHSRNATWMDAASGIESPAIADTDSSTLSEQHIQNESPVKVKQQPAENPIRVSARSANICTEWLRFELAVFAAILLGSWLGRGLENSGHFVAFVLCATVGNIWLNTPQVVTSNFPLAVPEAAGAGHPLSLLRIPWPPHIGQIGLSPLLTEILCFSAVLEAAHNMRFHIASILFGTFAGYCGGSFFALDPPTWPALPALLCGLGTLVASWPDLKIKATDAVRALLVGVTLMAALLGLTLLRRRISPPPEPPPETIHYPGTAFRAISRSSRLNKQTAISPLSS